MRGGANIGSGGLLDLSKVEDPAVLKARRRRKFRLRLLLAVLLPAIAVTAYLTTRLPIPAGVSDAYRAMDNAMVAKDPKTLLDHFPSDVQVELDGKPLRREQYAQRMTGFLRTPKLKSIAQKTALVGARSIDENTVEVQARQEQTISMEGEAPYSRRLRISAVWGRTATGWMLKTYRSRSLRIGGAGDEL